LYWDVRARTVGYFLVDRRRPACIIVMFIFHCTHVRMSYVLNSYLLTYFSVCLW